MSKKVKRLNKETRQCLETVSELFKTKDGNIKLKKGKGKKVKKTLKSMCFHWLVRKGECRPMVETDPEDSKYWVCHCGARFRKFPPSEEDREEIIKKMMELINTFQFYSVEMGGDKDDAALFLKMKKLMPSFAKMIKEISKAITKKADYESNKNNSDSLNPLDSYYSDFSYR